MKIKTLEGKKNHGSRIKPFQIPFPSPRFVFDLFKKRNCFVVEFKKNYLTLSILARGQMIAFEPIALRENPPERVNEKVSHFLSQSKYEERLLVLPRSEILLKEIDLSDTLNASSNVPVEMKLQKFFPCSPKEMAWGISLAGTDNGRGLLFAIPNTKISEILEFLHERGLAFDEVVSEDQLLWWLMLEKKKRGKVLFFDQGEERILAAFFKEGRLCFSRSFARPGNQGFKEMAEDVFDEISMALLETGEKPGEVFLAGPWASEETAQIEVRFALPVERFEVPHPPGFPPFLLGASYGEQFPRVSLLPLERKIEKKVREEKKLAAEVSGSFLLLIGSLILAFMIHDGLNAKMLEKMNHEIHALVPEVSEAKKLKAFLEVLKKARKSKETLLLFQRELSQRAPSSVRLLEFRLEGNEMRLKGESPSHAFLSEMVQAIGETKIVESPQIEQTRVRKRFNEDFFEFEVAGKWNL